MAQTDMPEEFSTGPSTCTRSKGWRSGSCSRERRAQPAPSRIRSPMGRCPEGRVWRSRSKPRAISGRPNEDASVAVRVVAQGAGRSPNPRRVGFDSYAARQRKAPVRKPAGGCRARAQINAG